MASTQVPTSAPQEPAELPMGKFLASSDKKTRDKAIKALTVVLSRTSKEPLSRLEMAKLWKGLYFCFWMSDKPLVQQALASELAELLLVIPNPESSLEFLKGFWEMMVREWSNIDYLRIDKFYMLVRRFVNASFRMLGKANWNARLCETYRTIISGPVGPLSPENSRLPSSLTYHMADIYVEELDKALASTTSRNVPLIPLVAPFVTIAARTPISATLKRVQSSLLDPLLTALSTATSDGEPRPKRQHIMVTSPPTYSNVISSSAVISSGGDSPTGSQENQKPSTPDELRLSLLKKILEVASSEDTRDANRKKLYAIWKVGMAEGVGLGGEWDGS